MGLQGIIFNIFQLTSTEAMSSYDGRFVKFGVVFNSLSLENEVGDPPIFFAFPTLVTHYLTVAKLWKKSVS